MRTAVRKRMSFTAIAAIAMVTTLAACSSNSSSGAGSSTSVASSPAGTSSAAAGPTSGGSTPTSGGASGPADKVSLGLASQAAVSAPAIVAVQQGYFTKYNIDADVSVIATGPLKTAVAGGSVQFGSGGGPTGEILSLTNGAVTIIGNSDLAPLFQLIAAPDIKTIADLKGQPIGITGAGSTTTMFTALALKTANLSLNDVKTVVGTDTSALVQMFASGTIKAITEPPPNSDLLLKALTGSHVLVDFNQDQYAPWPNQQTYANTAFIKAHPDITQRFMDAMDLGIEKFEKDPAAAKQAILQLTPGLSDADEEAAYKAALIGMSVDQTPTVAIETKVLTNIAVLGDQYTQYSKPDKAATVFDDTFAKQALKDTGVTNP